MLVGAFPAYARAAGVGVELGPITTEGMAVRGYALWQIRPILAVEPGALVVRQGVVIDVTPMLRTTGPLFVSAGVGFGYNSVDNVKQSRGAIFHDVLGAGYTASQRVTLRCEMQHWSNGGPRNPVFGTHVNRGYTALLLGMTYSTGR